MIIFDVMMFGEDGVSLMVVICEMFKMLIMLLIVKGEIEDWIKGFEVGVDDYFGKLFEFKELLLCINVILWWMFEKFEVDLVFKVLNLGLICYDIECGEMWQGDMFVWLMVMEN